MNTSIQLPSLFKQLEEGHQVITVNQRLSDALRTRYGQWHEQQGKPIVFWGEQIQSLTQWVQNQWLEQQYHQQDLPVLLTEHQERALWLECIQADRASESLLSVEQLVAKVQQAWLWIQHWCLPFAKWQQYPVDDVQAFVRWARSFQQHCRAQNWLSQAELPGWLAQQPLPSTSTLLLIGFVEVPPQIQTLLSVHTWSSVGLTHEQPCAQLVGYAAVDPSQERLSAMRWAQLELTQNPNQRIKIVVPNLLSERDAWVRLAEDQFQDFSLRYNISGGEPLSQQPLVQGALVLLQSKIRFDVKVIQQLLVSPFLKGAEAEIAARHQLQFLLPQVATPKWGLRACQQWLQGSWQTPILQEVLTSMLSVTWPESTDIAIWFEHFKQLLVLSGWPGEQGLTSAEYQVVERLKAALQQFQTLASVITRPLSAGHALQLLARICSATLFQPQSPANTQLEIVGALESVGVLSDQAWICQLTAESFPASATPNPFIPLQVQRSQQLPHATAARELEYARLQLQQWQQQAGRCIVSFAHQDGDQPLSMSPLLRGVQLLPMSLIAMDDTVPYSWEDIEEQPLPAISQQEIQQLKGGSGVFKAQSHCAFQAASRFRWQIEGVSEIQDYWGPRERGMVMHEALQQIWQGLKDHAGLTEQLEAGELLNQVTQAVERVLSRWVARLGYWLKPVLLQAELQRMSRLILDWLQLEVQRSPFKVLAKEQKVIGQVAGIPIHMQVDRIDELPCGERLVIDYKTAQLTYRTWLTERPSEPQLPLYAVMTHADGIAYACIREHALGFSGVTASDTKLQGVLDIAAQKEFISNTWSEQLDHWSQVLESLAQEFCSGAAAVDPVDSSVCQYCEYHRLCRIGMDNV